MQQETRPRRLRASVQIEASAERVLQAFLDPEQLKQWWGATRGLVEPRRGGTWALAWGNSAQGYQFVLSGVIRFLHPARRLRIEHLVYFNAERPILGPIRLSVLLREKDGLTRLTVRQEAFGEGPDWEWYYEVVGQGWKDALGNLKRFLETAG